MQIVSRLKASIPMAVCLLLGVLTGCSARTTPPLVAPAPFVAAPIPADAQGQQIRLGKLIFDDTPKYAHAYVGNQFTCSDCHLQSGTAAYAAPMIDMAEVFPAFSQRAGRVISLQERIQECFTRSENGQPPSVDSKEMNALMAYINWLSNGGVKGKSYGGRGLVQVPDLKGNLLNGRFLYAHQCAVCHGDKGAGIPHVLPPMWGPGSYNDGAGMNQPPKMAAFLVRNMPQNHPGTLSPQDAFDVATFIHSMPRPAFNPAYKGY
jgi:thiosulfate dehydrogenase